MKALFSVIYSDLVSEFLEKVEPNARKKIIYNIDKSRYTLDPRLFKKLDKDIWEFRTKYNLNQYRLLAFWDKRNKEDTLVIATHGFVKKTGKVAKKEIEKAKDLMEYYFKIT